MLVNPASGAQTVQLGTTLYHPRGTRSTSPNDVPAARAFYEGSSFERCPDSPEPDAKGVHCGMGPDIASFTDPAGDVPSVLKT